ncbi:hypothetical protein BG011_002712 [Mortierella polycephala]|uniref:Uncharacterized protein n=1 Tax=Mortierella polycephala TaxID=41804 RepID=A0A9P6UAH6_9FUNG|nr:hypothetical protein BG011_002712 [Mortierella polycephala]
MSCKTWELLYKREPSPFVIDDLSESYWARKSWPLLLELLDDVKNMYMLDGEKTGIESSRRRNQGRTSSSEEDTPRKRFGRKLDMIARDVVEKKDWAIFLKENRFDLFREQLTIMLSRLDEAHDDSFQKVARFFGIYTGDRGFQAFELRPAGEHSYVTLHHVYHPHELPTNMNDLKAHFQGLTKLLQIRMCLLATIEMYRSTTKAAEDGTCQEEDDMWWLYEGGKEGFNANLFMASSPSPQF